MYKVYYLYWDDLTAEEQDDCRYMYEHTMNDMYGLTPEQRTKEALDAALSEMWFTHSDEGDIEIVW